MEKFDQPHFSFSNEAFDLHYYHEADTKICIEPFQNSRRAVISYCLQNNFFIRPHIVSEGSFLVSQNSGASAVSEGPSCLLQVYTDSTPGITNGTINPCMIKTILELLENKNPLTTAIKTRWLLEQTANKNEDNYISWQDAEPIYKTIRLLDGSDKIFTTEEVVKNSGIKKYRFQKGCTQLYGISLKEMLYERTMKIASQLLLEENKPAEEISRLLGYRSHENFITGFKKYFATTPLVMQKIFE